MNDILLPTNYLWSLLLHQAILAAVCFVTGLAVQRAGWRVNYTRKINHFALMVVPFGLAIWLPYQPSGWTATATLIAFLTTSLLFVAPIRQRIGLIQTAFASIDRPEDQPYSLLWILSQAVVSYLVLLAALAGLAAWDVAPLVAIPLVVTGIGDGLAEPVGVRFGKHAYRVPSLVSGRTYHRTLEGSGCVMAVGLVTVAVVARSLPWAPYLTILAVVPVAMTVAEAVSPHTWDAPLLYAVGGGMVLAIVAAF